MKRLLLLVAVIVTFPVLILRPDWVNAAYNWLADRYWDTRY